jgi:hypothetical protein
MRYIRLRMRLTGAEDSMIETLYTQVKLRDFKGSWTFGELDKIPGCHLYYLSWRRRHAFDYHEFQLQDSFVKKRTVAHCRGAHMAV